MEATRIHHERLGSSRKNLFKFIHISTDEVFGSLNHDGKFNEKSQYRPRSPYSASKAASDHLANAWFHTFGIPIIITNCCNNYGPWQYPEKLIPLTIKKVLKKQKIPIYGKGENIREWLYVGDHVDALLEILRKGRIGENYCIGSGCELTNKIIVKKICDSLDSKVPSSSAYQELITYVPDRLGHDFRYSVDTKKIINHTGWKAKYSIDTGLEKTINWYLNNIEWLG